ncbi:peptidylprolyl isomerase/peptidyl-prolyl cis-trans isomerase A (cyclophilin A)/peptidyl-prolyl cis-trans isomerase B (cyclophilin B) [Mariprofundus ferrinatatus]|uniref:Peptidyl-prolyl cis-trans isomerase n=1 Tax=Mariprofundus ferrinatatus TaxID=1921087 RepID=A0A2K8LCP7_9PROT|nr:peptidylprolyl isomerase/peptidyl-prolyl cis-trans isomerase A (cyclophilin A)/peptidyl-prolyl cis-trans isomerase B (cyclophilin B) [Mariprofundus ferrinatatus]
MMKLLMKSLVFAMIFASAVGMASAEDARRHVEIQTTKGSIEIELYADRAPETVNNFLRYALAAAYDGTVFHRVIPGFMIQGGGFEADFRERPTASPIRNEADNGLKNLRGTLAMARTGDPHSATSQFFINLKDNGFLDFRSRNMNGWGYAVFGKVTKGMDVVDEISMVQTTSVRQYDDVPVVPVVIKGVTVR